ncbi:MAG: BatD family protein [Cellvibrionaceae bacterium]
MPTTATPFSIRPYAALLLSLIFFALYSPGTAAKSELVAKVDRQHVSLEETLKLTLRYNEQVMFGEPDISQLHANFDVLGNHRSNQYRSVNGRAESWTQWSLTLAPKKEGKLLIPSFSYKGAFSEAIEITVKKAASYQSTTGNKPIFIESSISKPEAFVQEQLIYTIRLFTSVGLTSLNRQDFAVENALLKQVSENRYQRNVGGNPYSVIEIAYAIFPQQSGNLTIPAHTWDVTAQARQGQRYDPFLSRRGQRLRLRVEQQSVSVLPKPANYSGNHWLPAADLSLSQSWSQAPNTFKVGEPITRTLSISAKGLMASQLPPLILDEVNGVKYYPDQPQSEEAPGLDGITTLKAESYAIVPNKPGRFTLPAVTLTWWDTQQNRMREASLPIQTIEVGGEAILTAAANEEPTTSTSASNDREIQITSSTSRTWLYVSIVSIAFNILLAMLWWSARSKSNQHTLGSPTTRPQSTDRSESSRYKHLKSCLQGGDENQIRQALLLWGQSFYAQHQLGREPLTRLQELGQLSPALRQAISELESRLYAQNTASFNPSALAQAIEQLRKNPPQSDANRKDELPPLYHPH